MKRTIQKDEWYPVYVLTEPHSSDDAQSIVNVPADLVAQYNNVMEAFDALQERLIKVFDKAGLR